ncbi:phosphoribosylamine--glycine ligase [Candidatus Curtissbacteria bacterium RIFCSPHIGHO2_01_FULL_40_12]|uniref:phosphoribosylamine--glycine ligase n=1 Tax=Candidatus Curtissbacteria bacterium RIFCSPHIGHO2_01_FULL_40_12 TaxID=1797710 RepID=A0A1F5GBS9_9BACT|nr:MAG: phosphoribosylamine--glycine ligase [Candidatus Curtissbacteria bacterium RIFCSPHIGHO2_01_FULL_40_12]
MKATVLVIDGGGRGHVLVQKYLESPHIKKVFAIPGNDLMLENNGIRVKIFQSVKTTDIKKIKLICQKEKVDLVDVAQDDAVAAGLVDKLTKSGLKVLGPTQAAGQIEWDKAWARNFMKKFLIPIPQFIVCKSQAEGIKFIRRKASLIESQTNKSWFIKASGLAAGKGALFARDNQEASLNIKKMANFGKAGKTYLIEEFVEGEEFSSFAIVNGTDFKIIGHAQDHKTVYDGDLGPNTGGMGCSSPPMVITKSIEKQIESIFAKTTKGLVQIKRPYLGILYLGGIIDKGGNVIVIEFNARWGDPEAQVIVPAIKNDFYELTTQVLNGKINEIKIKKDNFYRVAVTAASRGYPKDYSKVVGKKIIGLEKILKLKNVQIFGAGVKVKNRQYLAAGGRLFYMMAQGRNVAEARKMAYNALSRIRVEGDNLHYRTDIGWRDLKRYYSNVNQ